MFSYSIPSGLETSWKEDASLIDELNYLQMKQSLRLWNYIRKVCDDGNLLYEEYSEWKSLYPDYIKTDKQFGYAEDPEIEKRIEEVSAEIEANKLDEGSDPKPSKRPRKTRL